MGAFAVLLLSVAAGLLVDVDHRLATAQGDRIPMTLAAAAPRIVASIFARALGQLAMGAAAGAAVAAALEQRGNLMRDDEAVVPSSGALFMVLLGLAAALVSANRANGSPSRAVGPEREQTCAPAQECFDREQTATRIFPGKDGPCQPRRQNPNRTKSSSRWLLHPLPHRHRSNFPHPRSML
jgi:hypothetical protein